MAEEGSRASWQASAGVIIGVIVAALFAVYVFRGPPQGHPQFGSDYHAILLGNGTAYYGKIERGPAGYLTLTDVYYIQTTVNPETRQQSNALIKRGNELHAPTRMMVNLQHVVLIEPVGAQSQVARLIAESKQRAPEQKPEQK